MDNVSLREFMDQREAEIKATRAELLIELKELKAARQAIEGQNTANARKSAKPKPTIKEMVLSIFKDESLKLTSDQVLDLINKKFNTSIERSSLSPQLSRLKDDDKKLHYDEKLKTWGLRGEELTLSQIRSRGVMPEVKAPALQTLSAYDSLDKTDMEDD